MSFHFENRGINMSTYTAADNATVRSSNYEYYMSDADYTSAITGDAVLSGGIATLYYFMDVLSQQSNELFKTMQDKATVSSDAQGYANRVDEDISVAAASGDSGTCKLNSDTYLYMLQHHINVNGLAIYDYIDADDKLDQGQLQAIKSSLETVSNQASDYVSQSQLQIQKIMQTYNVTVSLINSMQTMLAEMNKSIAQNIR
jgi:secreted effector protein SseB